MVYPHVPLHSLLLLPEVSSPRRMPVRHTVFSPVAGQRGLLFFDPTIAGTVWIVSCFRWLATSCTSAGRSDAPVELHLSSGLGFEATNGFLFLRCGERTYELSQDSHATSIVLFHDLAGDNRRRDFIRVSISDSLANIVLVFIQ